MEDGEHGSDPVGGAVRPTTVHAVEPADGEAAAAHLGEETLGRLVVALVAGSSKVSVMLSGPRLLALVAVGSYPVSTLAVAADGRLWKYCGSGVPLSSVNACPMSVEPTRCPAVPLSE